MNEMWWVIVGGIIGSLIGLLLAQIADLYANALTTNEPYLERIAPYWVGGGTGLLTAMVIYLNGLTLMTPGLLCFTWVLVLLLLLDLKTWLLPDLLTLPLIWLGLIMSDLGAGQVSLHESLWGSVVGYVILWLVHKGYLIVTGKQGIGQGDFKLLAAMGAWLGLQALPIILFVASCLGIGFGLILMWRRRAGMYTAIPFGPFLAAAGFLVMFKHGH